MFISTISHSLSRTHGVTEDRNWWSKHLISFFLLFWFGITIFLCFSAMVFGEMVAGIAEVNFQLTIPLQYWVALLSPLLTAVALVVLALFLYLLTPENYLTFRQAIPGAIFFAGGWIGVTKLFQYYVATYDRYNPTYHALASIIMLLFWIYLTCLFLLLGGKLNAILRRERERAPPGSKPRWVLNQSLLETASCFFPAKRTSAFRLLALHPGRVERRGGRLNSAGANQRGGQKEARRLSEGA